MSGQRQISVGIFSAAEIHFRLLKECLAGGVAYSGEQVARWADGRIAFGGGIYDELVFEEAGDALAPEKRFSDAAFALAGVTIGVNFHWERQETQVFAGKLRIIVEGDKITAINVIGIEDYLRSVISSEMKATASPEFLKAHAVISRSWLIAQIERKNDCEKGRPDFIETEDCIVSWQDREDHERFDVCADDHCQRYQGLTRVKGNPRADEAILATWGQVLVHDGKVCDARFSKCCGGITENFSTCWENVDYPYLTPVKDAPAEGGADFCDCHDTSVLAQVLNDYDLETGDFYKWRAEYGRKELAGLIRKRSGIDFGTEILRLEPLERGASGRIKLMLIEGTARTMKVGKELTIRRWLSESHLKSSAFGVSYSGDKIILDGRGWGHGVGLCQIGAAVMGHKGYTYREILAHYFPGAVLIG